MALEKSITLECGIVLPNAYVKIQDITVYNKSGDPSYVLMTINIYKDADARHSGLPEVTQMKHKVSGGHYNQYFQLSILKQLDKTVFSQAYAWMKTRSLYSGGINIVDSKE